MLSDEWFVRFTPLKKLYRNFVENFVINSMNVTDTQTDEWTDKWKDETFIPLGINAWGIIIYKLPVKPHYKELWNSG